MKGLKSPQGTRRGLHLELIHSIDGTYAGWADRPVCGSLGQFYLGGLEEDCGLGQTVPYHQPVHGFQGSVDLTEKQYP